MSKTVPDKIEQRRRILRSAVGATAVFTLPIGADVAAASMACNLKPANPSPTLVTSTPDTWVRVNVRGYGFKLGGQKVRGFTYDNVWYWWNNGIPQRVPDAQAPPSNGPDKAKETGQTYYVLVDYPNGNIVTTAPSNASLASASCWTSLQGVAGIPKGAVYLK
jgi:hypothetical protein